MMTAEEARKMFLVNYDLVTKHQTEQLLAIVENSIIYACENGRNITVVDITTYNNDAISNVEEIIGKNGYQFVQCSDYIRIGW